MSYKKVHSLRYTDEGVYLSLLRDKSMNSIQLKTLIRAALTNKKISNIDFSAVDRVISGELSEAIIAPPQIEVPVDESVSVSIKADGSEATSTFFPADGGKLCEADDIINALHESGVVHGIDMAVVESLANNPFKEYYAPIVIARATPPVKGEDAWIENFFDTNTDAVPKLLEDGSVDHKNLGLFNSIEKGAILSTLHPETDGIPGTDVRGNPIAAQKGKSKKLSAGKNTVLSEDGLHLIATESGRAEVSSGRTSIVKSISIRGNVDLSTGNVEFFGDVSIGGNVLSKFSVIASGTIDIGGGVEASFIKADGPIIIRQGIKGNGVCEVRSGGDITTKFIENATIVSGGTVRSDYIMNSNVSSNSSVIVSGRYGLVVGGTIQATHIIAARRVGGVNLTPTTLDLGIAPHIKKRCDDLRAEIEKNTKELAKLTALEERFSQLDNRGLLSGAQKTQYLRLTVTRGSLEITLQEKNLELSSYQNLLSSSSHSRVHIKDEVYPNTTIIFGSVVYKVTELLKYVTFRLDGGQIVTIPYAFSDNI